ncbi:flagellar basal body rod C-terminal domain-containing protein [Desulfohalovibrio reitneri]|uniref:flagellar basal body rod C-terminal domain-containing protein n=1 Tax=Desulfohalovibrio reitneri TaxID=1307759 RepID=UPI0004A74A88|nr:flagellar basal body rod C-terminal domain-containing protein [Desulfohalovibrio reitneri]
MVNASALDAFGVQAWVAANNIANVNTPGYQAQRASLTTGPDGRGVEVESIRRDAAEAPLPASVEASLSGAAKDAASASNVDLGREMVDLMRTETAYQANATVISNQDAITGSLIDELV